MEHISSKNNGNSAFRKYLRSLPASPIIQEVEFLDTQNMKEVIWAEKYWIEQFRQWGFILYNKSWNNSSTTFNAPDIELKTDSFRIDKSLHQKIKILAKKKGQTVAGYIVTALEKPVNRDYKKLRK